MHFQELGLYINNQFGQCSVAATLYPAWESYAEVCESINHTSLPVGLKNPDRRWEIVSSYQKSVRRGRMEHATRALSAICSDPSLLEYMWRRVLTTAAEDVGYGNQPLMVFVMAASQVYKNKLKGLQAYNLLYGLTELMAKSERSRIFCSLSIIYDCRKNAETVSLLGANNAQVTATLLGTSVSQSYVGMVGEFCKQKAWTTEYMSQYFGYRLPHGGEPAVDLSPEPEFEMLHGLPSYSYDMHTRIGKKVLSIISKEKMIKEWLKESGAQEPLKYLGYASFYGEGGWIQWEKYDDTVRATEFMHVDAKFRSKLPIQDLVFMMQQPEIKSKMNTLKKALLVETYGT